MNRDQPNWRPVPAIVFGSLTVGELRIALQGGEGLAAGGKYRDVPIDRIPRELRRQNTLLWVQLDEKMGQVVRAWRRDAVATPVPVGESRMPIDVRGLCPLLQVFDMPSSITFYRDVLGFEIVEQSEPGDQFDWALLKLNDAELMLNTAYEAKDRPQQPDATRVAAHEDTGLFFSCADVDDAYQYLQRCGYEVDPPFVQGYGMKQLYVRDPDGYCVCFQEVAK